MGTEYENLLSTLSKAEGDELIELADKAKDAISATTIAIEGAEESLASQSIIDIINARRDEIIALNDLLQKVLANAA